MAGPLSDFHLDPGIPSPCIDAGDPAEMYNDPEDPMTPGYALWPSLGTIRNDMGAYGGGGAGVWTGMEEGESPEPLPGNILAAFPNPMAGLAVARIVQPTRAQATLSLYDLSGRLVLTLFTGELEPGEQFLPIDARALGTGMYFLRFSTAELTDCTRITLIR
jgi:hypothetical protein